MNEKRRNELFRFALQKALSELNEHTTHQKRTEMINVIEFVHCTNNEQKALKSLKEPQTTPFT
jgi:metal-responsive CopG/Arc/MetJ family transcriptional regulator